MKANELVISLVLLVGFGVFTAYYLMIGDHIASLVHLSWTILAGVSCVFPSPPKTGGDTDALSPSNV
jgi:hypothetical protein